MYCKHKWRLLQFYSYSKQTFQIWEAIYCGICSRWIHLHIILHCWSGSGCLPWPLLVRLWEWEYFYSTILFYSTQKHKQEKKNSCPRWIFETWQTRDFCQNHGILLVIRVVVTDSGYSVLSVAHCLKEWGSLRSLRSFWMLSRHVWKLSKVRISRVRGTRFTCLWWNCR